MSLQDIKIPASPSDQQTTDAKSALPPVEFQVATSGTANVISIHDRQGVQNRLSTSSYRIYFLPEQFAPRSTGNTTTVPSPAIVNTAIRQAGRLVANLVADVRAPGLGTVLQYSDSVNVGSSGYYYCVGVNRAGVEAPSEHIVLSEGIAGATSGTFTTGGGGGSPVGPAISVETSYAGGTITGTIDGINTSFTMGTAFATYDVVFVDGIIDVGATAIGFALTTSTPPISSVTVEHLG